jgi:hypothetical protein
LLYSMRDSIGILLQNMLYAWQPYGQTEGSKINAIGGANFWTENSTNNRRYFLVYDGYNHKMIQYHIRGSHNEHYTGIRYGGSAVWFFPLGGDSLTYGTYLGDENQFLDSGGGASGWLPARITYGYTNSSTVVNYNIGRDATSLTNRFAGLRVTTSAGDPDALICDVVEHKGTIYLAKQYGVYGLSIGGRGNYVHQTKINEVIADQGVPEVGGYTSRISRDDSGYSKCFAKHKGRLFMLQNDGKIYEVLTGGIIEKADLTTLGTQWSSGIIGGAEPGDADSPYTGIPSARRCFIASFNGELHAFLNFGTAYQIAEGSAGNGIFWATSPNGVNWQDKSPSLPSSGIQVPSGLSSSYWRTLTTPYVFSGRVGTTYPSGYPAGGSMMETSGVMQSGSLPFWSSGVFNDTAGTHYANLQVPMENNTVSGFLFPTWVQKPVGWGYVSPGFWGPSGFGGPSGWDFTGCTTYHIAGYVSEEEDVLKLLFTRDLEGGTLFYDLDTASGWIRRNWLPHAKQLNGIIPIDLYTPEVIIPSGTLYRPNPIVDVVNNRAFLDYAVYDWGYWDPVNMRMQYSINNGQDWHNATNIKIAHASGRLGLSTGSEATDPSGVIGRSYTICWDYGRDLNPNVYYENVKLRLRAEA